MSTIRCPKCKLINAETARSCRRCGASLSPSANKDVGSKSRNSGRAALWVIPAVVIVAGLCIYGFYKHSNDTSSSGAGPAGANKAAVQKTASSPEFESIKKIARDFLAQLDRNIADPKADGHKKNQTLAYETMMLLRQEQNKLTDSATQKYADEFYQLLEKYYDQLVRYNSESAHLADVRQRIQDERDKALEDSSLSPEAKHARKFELWDEKVREDKMTTVSAGEIEATVKSLRELALSTGSK